MSEVSPRTQVETENNPLEINVQKENNGGRNMLEVAIFDAESSHTHGYGTFNLQTLKAEIIPDGVVKLLGYQELQIIRDLPDKSFYLTLTTNGLTDKKDEATYFQSVWELLQKLREKKKIEHRITFYIRLKILNSFVGNQGIFC